MSTKNVAEMVGLKPTTMRLKEILPLVPFGRSTLLKMVTAGTFPAPTKLGARCCVWRIDEVRSWLKSVGKGGRA